MNHGIHFIAGLPRSGSTLLAGILRQNPRFHAGMTSPVGSMYMALETTMSRRNEAAVFITDQQRRAILSGLFSNYYDGIHQEKTAFDTNRVWCTKLPALTQLFPKARFICCVRDIGWIMDSVERLVRRNAFELSGMFGFEAGGTVFSRVARLASGDGLVGYALDALREAYFSEQANRLILVEYQALTRAPRQTMALLYQMLGEEPFTHDFNDVDYQADQFDAPIGAPGLHTVRRRVEWTERQTVLPPGLFERFAGDAFWRSKEFQKADVPLIAFESQPPK
jgi:sulfotransferase